MLPQQLMETENDKTKGLLSHFVKKKSIFELRSRVFEISVKFCCHVMISESKSLYSKKDDLGQFLSYLFHVS